MHIYLDYNASTPIHPAVAFAMGPFLEDHYGNPSSGHWAATTAKTALETARGQVAVLLGCQNDDIVFTSGGSEANNFALKGVFVALRHKGHHIITTRVEHPAIIEPCRFLERLGARVTYLPVDGTGRIDPDELRKAITPGTILISIMHANNEVGTIQPIADCAQVAHEHGLLFHTDAAQSVGKVRTDVKELGVDLLSIAGHKLYAPKGVGALFVRRGVSLEPLIHGAGHEGGRRAGTESPLLACYCAWTRYRVRRPRQPPIRVCDRNSSRGQHGGHRRDDLDALLYPGTTGCVTRDAAGPYTRRQAAVRRARPFTRA